MAKKSGRNERARGARPEQERQGVREPRPADLGKRRELDAAEVAREDGERDRDREREPEEPESAAVEGAGGDRTP